MWLKFLLFCSPADTEASMKIQEMGVLPLLPTLLSPQSSCTPKVANIIAEVAKNGEVRFPSPSTQEHPDFLFLHSSVFNLYTFSSSSFCFPCFLHKYIIWWDTVLALKTVACLIDSPFQTGLVLAALLGISELSCHWLWGYCVRTQTLHNCSVGQFQFPIMPLCEHRRSF